MSDITEHGEARPSTSRQEALQLIRAARRIFIIYSSADLALTRDLRRRMIRLRKGTAADTVFFAADSLPTGQDVSPEAVRVALERADLAVVACGVHTPRSPFVTEEIRQAMIQRCAGTTKILPVILKTGVRLPDGIDFSIQAVHRTTLFPSIRWIPIAAAAAIATLIVVSGLIWRNGESTRIHGSIAVDDLIGHSPIDLERVARLAELRARAAVLQLREAEHTLGAKLARAATPAMREQWLPADADRRHIVTDPAADVVWVGSLNRIEAMDASSRQVIQTIDLATLEVGDFQPAPILAAAANPGTSSTNSRQPAHLIRLYADPRTTGLLAEVEYASFATDNDQGLGPDASGSETEVLRIARNVPNPESVGLSREIEVTTLHGGPNEAVSLPFGVLKDHRASVEARLSSLAQSDVDNIHAALPESSSATITLLARDPVQPAALVEIAIPAGAEYRDQDWADSDSITHYLVVLLSRREGVVRVVPTTQYYKRKGELSTDDNLQWHFSDEIPDYRPAALRIDRGAAWLHDNPIAVPPHTPPALVLMSGPDYDVPPPSPLFRSSGTSDVRWIGDSPTVRVAYGDGSLARAADAKSDDIHRFLRPPDVVDIDLTPDGTHVLVLYKNGQVDRWQLDPFGSDGWVTAAHDPAALNAR